MMNYKVFTPGIDDSSWFCLSFLGPLDLLLPNTFTLLIFPIFWFSVYLMKIISETRRI